MSTKFTRMEQQTVDLPEGIRMLTNGRGQRALTYDPGVYSIYNVGDMIVVTNLAHRSTELIIPGNVRPGPTKVGVVCQCGQHVITTADC